VGEGLGDGLGVIEGGDFVGVGRDSSIMITSVRTVTSAAARSADGVSTEVGLPQPVTSPATKARNNSVGFHHLAHTANSSALFF
jgi:hypothetical protein